MTRRSVTGQFFLRVLSLAAVLVALCLVVCIPGCSSSVDSDDDDDEEVVISEDAFIVDDVEDVTFVEAGSTSVVLNYVGDPPDIEVDDILVGSDGGGYLRKVVSVTVDGGTITVETAEATLSDVIEEGTLQFDGVLDPWRAMRDRGTLEQFGSTALPGVSIDEDGWYFADVELIDDEVGGVDIEVRLTGTRYHLFEGVTEFHCIAEGRIDFTLEAEASVSATLEFGDEGDLFTPIVVGVYPIPGLPLWVDVAMGIEAGFALTALGEIYAEAGIDGSAGIAAGARWEQGSGWEDVWDPSLDVEITEQWGIDSGAAVRVYLRPYVVTRIASVAGPYIGADAYLEYEVDLTPPPPDDWCWYLNAGAGAGLGFEVAIFGWELFDYYTTLADYSVTVDSECDEEPEETGTIVIDPDPNSLNAPWTLTGPQNESGNGDATLTEMPVGQYTLTWGAVSGYVTPSSDTKPLDPDETITFAGTYVEAPGSIVGWGHNNFGQCYGGRGRAQPGPQVRRDDRGLGAQLGWAVRCTLSEL